IGIAPDEVAEILEHEPEAEEKKERGESGLVGARNAADEQPMESDADAEKKREGEGDAEEGIEMKAVEDFICEIGAEHQKTGVGEIYDFQDAVNDGHADGHGGIDAGEENGGDEQVQEIDSAHRFVVIRDLSSESSPISL